ncbi:MAG TPA: hypothetical protein ENL09_00330 [Bacteroidetes bacterium]|nr:hypothetical protein [Bacteroidota bacterium]
MRIMLIGGGRFSESLIKELLSLEEDIFVDVIEKSQERAEALTQSSISVNGEPLSSYYESSYIVVNMDGLSEDFFNHYPPERLQKYDAIVVATGDDISNLLLSSRIIEKLGHQNGAKKVRLITRLNTLEFSEIASRLGLETVVLPIMSEFLALELFSLRLLKNYAKELNIDENLVNEIKIKWSYIRDWTRRVILCISLPAEMFFKSEIFRRISGIREEISQSEEEVSVPQELEEISLRTFLDTTKFPQDRVKILGVKRPNGTIEFALSNNLTIRKNDVIYFIAKVPKGLDKIFELFTGGIQISEMIIKKMSGQYYRSVAEKGFDYWLDILEREILIFRESEDFKEVFRKINMRLREYKGGVDLVYISASDEDDKSLLKVYGFLLKLFSKILDVKHIFGIEPLPYEKLGLIFVTYDPSISHLITVSSRGLDVACKSVLLSGVHNVTNKIIGFKSLLKRLNAKGYDILEIKVPETLLLHEETKDEQNPVYRMFTGLKVISRVIKDFAREISKSGNGSLKMISKIESMPVTLINELPITLKGINKVLEELNMEELIEKFSVLAIEDADSTIYLPTDDTNIFKPHDKPSSKIYVLCEEKFSDDVNLAFSRIFNEYPWDQKLKMIFKKVDDSIEGASEEAKEIPEGAKSAWRMIKEKLNKEIPWLFSEE